MSLTTVDCRSKPVDWYGYFAGAWRMARRIDDWREGCLGEALGEADFAADPNTPASMICNEELAIDYGGRRWQARQRTLWRFYKTTGPQLFFSDGRFFCELRFGRRSGRRLAEFEHLCGDDRYEGVASIAGEHAWRMVWLVAGPRKSYRLDTEYRRID